MTLLVLVALLPFTLRTFYVAQFGLRNRLYQPFHYSKFKRLLNVSSTLTLLVAALSVAVFGKFLLAAALILGPLVVSHLVKFRNVRRAALEPSEMRLSDGQYVFEEDALQRDKAAMNSVNRDIGLGELE